MDLYYVQKALGFMLFSKSLSSLFSAETNQFYESKMQVIPNDKRPNDRPLPFPLVITIFLKS